ncbi:unnamed protein product [Nezara viridula]|uniref:Neuropeptide n=1 Tax=Nezara viridula TaxID=85310 RepID=A0A9P0HTB7_NEZVI|nr:unnamed protein product [Nezara viridula]
MKLLFICLVGVSLAVAAVITERETQEVTSIQNGHTQFKQLLPKDGESVGEIKKKGGSVRFPCCIIDFGDIR